VTHQPAISFSISLQNQFNRAGGRTFNVRQKYEKQASSRLSKIPARRLWIRNSSSFDHMGLLFLPTGKESSNA
jgi:hypothetical protein